MQLNERVIYSEGNGILSRSSFFRRGGGDVYSDTYFVFRYRKESYSKMNALSSLNFGLLVYPSCISIVSMFGLRFRSSFLGFFLEVYMDIFLVHLSCERSRGEGNVQRWFCYTCHNNVGRDVQLFWDCELVRCFEIILISFDMSNVEVLGHNIE